MQVKGMLFLSKAPVRLTRTADNRWQLTLLAVHRIANHQTEPWRLVWTGDEAEAFARRHQDDLKPGQPIHITAHQLRAHSVGVLTEIVAAVTRIEIHHEELAH